MYKIAICDSNKRDRESLYPLIHDYDPNASINIFKKPDTFLKEIQRKGCIYDIVVIEVHFGTKDGIQIADYINHVNVSTQIIFNTRDNDAICRAYSTDHAYYLLKDQWDLYLKSALDAAYKNIKQSDRDKLAVSFNGAYTIMKQQDIYYLERSKRITMIITSNGTYKTSANFSELAKQLNSHFIVCHRSYMVNLAHIKNFTRTNIQLSDETFISIGRTHYQQARSAFKNYLHSSLHVQTDTDKKKVEIPDAHSTHTPEDY
ncbi:MAG: LytTR family DNA-binding domain-containing protein [Lachnospiraceae bacterium]|nr:LytTR family DNA-binding domain-containing protein [Lachnospiraceae bacterium]